MALNPEWCPPDLTHPGPGREWGWAWRRRREMEGATIVKISDMQQAAYMMAAEKGFHDDLAADWCGTLVRLCLLHSEVSECVQQVKRHGVTAESKPRIAEELADVLIRVGDLAGTLGIDLTAAVAAKLAANASRPRKYGTPGEGR